MKPLSTAVVFTYLLCEILLISSNCFSQTFTCNYGGPGFSEGHSIALCPDSGFIITGLTKCFGDTSGNIYLIKTDRNGVIQWQQIHGSPELDGGNSVVTCPDGGYFIAGHTEGWGAGDCDGFAMKTDSRGDSVWMNTYGSTDDDVAYDGIVCRDGNYVMTGYTTGGGFGGEDVFLCKFDKNGNRIWVQRYGGKGDELAWSVKQTPDDGYVIVGYTSSYTKTDSTQIYLIKTDSAGNLQWQKTYGDSDTWDYRAYKVKLTPDGGYAIAGYCGPFQKSANSILLKTDGDGNLQWMKQYSGSEPYYLTGGMTTTSDGGYLLTGQTLGPSDSASKVLLLKADSAGNLQWTRTIGKTGLNYYASNVIQVSNGQYAFIGTSQINANEYDFLLMEIDSTGKATAISQAPSNTVSVTAYPNPSLNKVTFQLQYYKGTYSVLLYNMMGQLVKQYPNQVITTLNMDRNSLPSGIYFYQIENENNQVINKGKIALQ